MISGYFAGLDVGSTVCELVVINSHGDTVYAAQFATGERNLILHAQEARKKSRGELTLALEEGEMALWIRTVLKPEIPKVVICDPRRNAWIAKDGQKADRIDAKKLAQLLRGGFVREVFHAEDQDRIEFKRVVQHYHRTTAHQAGIKCKIKTQFRLYGIILKGDEAYTEEGRAKCMALLPTPSSRQVARQLYDVLDSAVEAQHKALRLMLAMGRKYPEVARFQEVPGIGGIWACTFSGFIQTPHRFPNKRKLWRFCKLGITNRQSNGEPLGYQKLDTNGVGALKRLSYHAFCSARGRENEFDRFFREAWDRTGDKHHARLSTQRKILAVLWAMWRKDEPYKPSGGSTQDQGQSVVRA